ncbi:hypothetical protein [Paraburkholderia sp. BCC1885]|uniref:hypothetical protein n=1 Tax=Paraburkholderia sp. BCC1885 TaxID=2562669 RepID=UPI0011843CBC|nr:hypothetical protein [Paraburkholderia sp. BCC1885]
MRAKGYYLTLVAMSFKFLMDFFIPAREITFIAFNGMLLMLVIVLRPSLHVSVRALGWTLVTLAFLILELCRQPENPISYKLLTLPVLAVLFYSAGRTMSSDLMARLFRLLLGFFLCCFVGNYLVSAALGHIESREFWNFEYANLLGSYVLIMLLPVNYVLSQRRRVPFASGIRMLFVVVAYLTTSTGAMVLALAICFRWRRMSPGRLILLGLSVCAVAGAGLAALYAFSRPDYDKIVAPFVLIFGGRWTQLVRSAQSAGGITEFAGDQQGSFTWRIYADLVYGFYIAHQEAWDTLFGNGIGGFMDVWNGAMPHNDFVLLLIDFGVVFLVLVIFHLLRLIQYVRRYLPGWLFVVMALVIRFAFENNIYSYYVISNAVIFASLVIGASKRDALHIPRRNGARLPAHLARSGG